MKDARLIQIAARVLEINKVLDAAKPLREELDLLTLELVKNNCFSAEYGTFVLSVVDNFQDTNTVFRPTGVKRYELKVKRKAI